MDMKRFFLYAIVIAALALAGCGSDGNGGMTAMPDPDPDPTPMKCPEGQTGTPPNCVPQPPTPMPPPMELVAGIVTANNKDYNATKPAPYSHPDRPGKTVDTDGGSTGDVLSIAVKRDGTIGDVNLAQDDGDPATALTNMRKLEKSDNMPPSVGRFASGSVHTRTNMGVTDTAYVYETKAAPRAQAWNMQYTVGATSITGLTITAPTASTTMQKFNILEFGTDVSGDDIRTRFSSDKFPSGGSQTYTYHPNTTYDNLPQAQRGSTDIRGQEFDGMFHGVPGKYSCSGTCTAATNNRGQVVTFAGTWRFTPNDLANGVTAHMVQGALEDADYLTFGYWVQKDEDDGDLTIGVSTFASGTALAPSYTAAAFANLEGTAEYDGKAVGKFVKKTLSPDGMATVSDGGTFTADANLTAHFSGNAVSFNDRFTVRGTIDDFRNSDGDEIDSRWSVTLKSSTFATAEDKSTVGFTFNGDTSAGGPAGKWEGAFYGTPRASTGDFDVPSDTNTDAYPTSVAGEFDAHFTNGHALGAFGATR